MAQCAYAAAVEAALEAAHSPSSAAPSYLSAFLRKFGHVGKEKLVSMRVRNPNGTVQQFGTGDNIFRCGNTYKWGDGDGALSFCRSRQPRDANDDESAMCICCFIVMLSSRSTANYSATFGAGA